MIVVKAKHLTISARKLKLIADLLKQKTVTQAIKELEFLPQNIAPSIIKLLKQALASASDTRKLDPASLKIKHIYANQGRKMRRRRFAGRGCVKPYVKQTSHLIITLDNH